MCPAYYNENDPDAAAWLRELIVRRIIAPGDVDDRSIKDVRPGGLRGYDQCHFFAGIGVWSYALRLAGWPDDRPVWTGSCPCQPFSVSGKGGGFDDPRDLWPHFFPLVRAGRPPVVMGELTSKKAGRAWFDRTHADLANEHYASRAVSIPSCAVDAPNERDRLYWCAVDVVNPAIERWREGRTEPAVGRGRHAAASADASGDMGDANSIRQQQQKTCISNGGRWSGHSDGRVVGDSDDARLAIGIGESGNSRAQRAAAERTDDPAGFWDRHEWIACHDGKNRRAKPGTSLLVTGTPSRIPMWRGLGNAINARLAEQVIRAFMEAYG